MDKNKQSKGLGKGLAALLPDTPIFLDEKQPAAAGEQVLQLDIEAVIANQDQPRQHFDAEKIAELAASIKTHGLLQPIIVRRQAAGKYSIIAGERRWRAAKEAGLTQIPCIVRVLDEQQIQELSLIENIQREDLLPLEEAEAYRSLLEQYGYTQEALAGQLGKSRSHIANTLRLLTLAPQYQDMLQRGAISAGHARALLSLDDPAKQARLAGQIIKQGLSVRQAEELARALKEAKPLNAQGKPLPPPADPIFMDIARRLKDKWGVKVAVNDKKGRGQIVIDYYSEDDLQRILDSLLEESL